MERALAGDVANTGLDEVCKEFHRLYCYILMDCIFIRIVISTGQF